MDQCSIYPATGEILAVTGFKSDGTIEVSHNKEKIMTTKYEVGDKVQSVVTYRKWWRPWKKFTRTDTFVCTAATRLQTSEQPEG